MRPIVLKYKQIHLNLLPNVHLQQRICSEAHLIKGSHAFWLLNTCYAKNSKQLENYTNLIFYTPA